jgi:hypothetical protein
MLVIMTFLLPGWGTSAGWAMLAPAIPSPEADAMGQRTAELAKIQNILETKVVRQRLEDLGLTPDEINSRLTQLSDAQLHDVATQIDSLYPGGILGVVIALLVIAILVVILVYLLQHREVIAK